MAISFGKKPAKPEAEETPWEGKPTEAIAAAKEAAKAHTKPAPKPQEQASSGGILKRGTAAKETFDREEAKAEARAATNNIRFWIDDGKDATITFLDGDLDADGMLDIPYYFEHNLQIGGRYGNHFACIQESEPCPICEGGDNPSYVGLLTIIDHRSYKSKAGKEFSNQVRLFVAKRQTIKQLQKLAEKRGGLAGCTFDASRTGSQSAAVGSMFDFTEKTPLATLKKQYSTKEMIAEPMNYEDIVAAITFTAEELRNTHGFGSLRPPVGSEADDEAPAKTSKYKGKL